MNMKCTSCGHEKEEKFKNGISWRCIVLECACTEQQVFVADEIAEDCNATEKASAYRGQSCETCKKKIEVKIIRTK